MVKVKICGITCLENALVIAKHKPDAFGFVFYKHSPRYVTPQKAKKIIKSLPATIKKVGVFVNQNQDEVKLIANILNLNMLQFHGDETPEYCGRFRDYKIIKAFRIKNKNSLKDINKYPVWGLMFDAYKNNFFGGTGKRFNWQLIKNIKPDNKAVFLSGGLNARNVQKAIRLIRPDWVDVSSSVELKPGYKDLKKVKEFIKQVKF